MRYPAVMVAGKPRGFLPRTWAEALVAGLPIGMVATFATRRVVFLWAGMAAFGSGLSLGSVQMLAERLRIDLKRAKVATSAWDVLWYGGYALASAGMVLLGLWAVVGKQPFKSPPLAVMMIGIFMLIEGIILVFFIDPLEPVGKKARNLLRRNGVSVRTFDALFVAGTVLAYVATNYVLLRHLR